jgi:hypothetical protein
MWSCEGSRVTGAKVNKGNRGAEHSTQASFLYLPIDIVQVLKQLPHLKGVVTDPTKEGTTSRAFLDARKSPLQIYRILANNHYDHLRALLESLNFCAGPAICPHNL